MSYPSYGVNSPGSNFAFAIVLFILLIIAGLGLFYLLRTLVWTSA
ncbi:MULTISPECIES: YjcZ family sporulation protein [unclassified Lysinibacillus]|nr:MULTISPECIES: YjcZ family sporulation protein [unclassified Lysinibacillus]MCL1694839.1 YjcZ family sporulation protein [Lysinibacillus sp. BPa_S21]MCL1699693.1 YjcZ family sporulation protein [Lysinibacillus sp. Bpr_S20]